jgi:hypothetical protein
MLKIDCILKMPNYCFNSLRIVGAAEEITEFLKHNLSFQHFVPCEVDQRNLYWGTKWGAIDLRVVHRDDTTCNLEFRTAWGPPIPFLTKLNALYPACWFKLVFEIELGWGSGLWIHYYTPKDKRPVERLLEWKEPYMTPCGLHVSDDESEEGAAIHPSPASPTSPRPEFLEPFPFPNNQS